MDFQKGYAKCAHCGETGLVFADEGFPSPIDKLFVIDCVCPKCGANLTVEDGIDMFYCQYCGAKIMLQNETNLKTRFGLKKLEHTEKMADKVVGFFEKRREHNPCSLCAKMRKGALNEQAKQLGLNKIAYGHHMDDVIETLLMSLFYEGRFHTFEPVTHLDQTGLTLIRPLLYVKEKDLIGFCNKYEIPVAKSPCPVDGHTKREEIKQLVRNLTKDNPGVKERIFTAIQNGHLEGWDKI